MSAPLRVLLTGASAGIGLATARALLARGSQVWGTARDASRIPAQSGIRPLQLEISDPASRARCCAQFLREAGGIDVLVNNAGNAAFGGLLSSPAHQIRQAFEIHALGPLDLIQRLVPALRESPRPIVVNVSSLAARLPIPFLGPYSAAKAALAALTATLRLEAPGIHWVDVQPGDIRTAFNRPMDAAAGACEDPRARAAWLAMEASMNAAPPPELAGAHISEIILGGTAPPPVAVVGDFTQSRLAPLAHRLLPARALEWFLRRHYDIEC